MRQRAQPGSGALGVDSADERSDVAGSGRSRSGWQRSRARCRAGAFFIAAAAARYGEQRQPQCCQQANYDGIFSITSSIARIQAANFRPEAPICILR